MTARSIVGIDLGTTHTAVARAGVGASDAPALFRIPQLVSPTEQAERDLLPSCLYAPLPHERFADAWGDAPWVAGELARRRGAEVSARFVASAKSWLGYGAVDRTAPILPWGSTSDADVPRISPVRASAKLLGHVRRAYDAVFTGEPLSEQHVVLTVPASFDEGARALTVEAARLSGLGVHLLEEPQAAFYDFWARVGDDGLAELLEGRGSALVLVCDVGGGTTDLSLVRVARADGPERVAVERVAVGHHLLLGGDNMDLALAHLCEARIVSPGERLEPARFSELVLACRAAKERLLGRDPPDQLKVAVASGGSRLVGAVRACELSREEATRAVIDGFFPQVDAGARPERRRSGFVAFGLPYEADVGITRHLGAFVARHAGEQGWPTALLLNGGVFHSAAVRERLRAVVAAWSRAPVAVLANPNPDLAVALGAVVHGRARLGLGRRIEGGAARGYYVGLEPRKGEPRGLLSVVPRGTREGEPCVVNGRPLALLVGRPVRFDLFASEDGPPDPPGAVVPLDEERHARLPPLLAVLEPSAKREGEVPVVLEGELSPVGTLEMSCLEVVDGSARPVRRFRLAFELRPREEPRAGEGGRASERQEPPPPTGRKLDEALGLLRGAFEGAREGGDARPVKELVRDLERVLGDRPTWTAHVSRELFDVLIALSKARKGSADHERVFWMLAGYTLRPGLGVPGDEQRARRLAPLFFERLALVDQARGWQQFWIAWRRVAAGLSEAVQGRIRDELDPVYGVGASRKKAKSWRREAVPELVELLSSLERVSPSRRAELGESLLERTYVDKDPRVRAALGRVGARVPTYASAHFTVAPPIVESWLAMLAREDWRGNVAVMQAAVSMARRTGDRARDLSASARAEVTRKLTREGAPAEWVRAVTEVVRVEEEDRQAFYGEGLPVGLRLLDPEG